MGPVADLELPLYSTEVAERTPQTRAFLDAVVRADGLIIVSLALSFLAGSASWFLVERPAIDWGRRLIERMNSNGRTISKA